jgi:hypothetical protein
LLVLVDACDPPLEWVCVGARAIGDIDVSEAFNARIDSAGSTIGDEPG